MEARPVDDTGGSPNARTVASYELIAGDYARETANKSPSGTLRRLVAAVPAGTVLELGSGPGWDADVLEEAGLRVRRTDVTQAFIDLQRGRGRTAERLDAISGEYGGPYDAVVALYVLQHVPHGDLADVLAKVAVALRPGGRFLVSVRVGDGAGSEVDWEVGESGNHYYLAFWSVGDFLAALAQVGLLPEWTDEAVYEASRWLTVLARLGPSGDAP